MLAARSVDQGRRRTLSPALPLGGVAVTAASFGPAATAAVIMPGGRADVITSSSAWHALPAVPAGTATLAPGPGGEIDALAVHGAALTIWRLAAGGTSWTKAQMISVPIQYGSSS